MPKRAAQGSGNIRKKTVNRKGETYTYWEARYTVGKDPGTGKQIQKSVSGQTQKEVREKLQAASVQINDGTYSEPSKMTVGQWLDIWSTEYLCSVKPRTVDSYKTTIKVHLKPALGATKLSALAAHDIQKFYNGLQKGTSTAKLPLSPKTIKNVHGVLHKSLEQAVKLGYIRYNPTNACELPRIERADIKPLNDEEIKAFLTAIQGHRYELIYIVTLFTGMREGEVLGLTWECIDFKSNTILIKQQLQKERGGNGKYHLVSPKNGKSRKIKVAKTVIQTLKEQKGRQVEWRTKAGEAWEKSDLVFTNELGHNLSAQTVYLHFKKFAEKIGVPEARFHDLRHSYAVAALQSGDDIKTVQENLGHYTAAFTLDVYAHVTDRMRDDSANRMEAFISSVKEA